MTMEVLSSAPQRAQGHFVNIRFLPAMPGSQQTADPPPLPLTLQPPTCTYSHNPVLPLLSQWMLPSEATLLLCTSAGPSYLHKDLTHTQHQCPSPLCDHAASLLYLKQNPRQDSKGKPSLDPTSLLVTALSLCSLHSTKSLKGQAAPCARALPSL